MKYEACCGQRQPCSAPGSPYNMVMQSRPLSNSAILLSPPPQQTREPAASGPMACSGVSDLNGPSSAAAPVSVSGWQDFCDTARLPVAGKAAEPGVLASSGDLTGDTVDVPQPASNNATRSKHQQCLYCFACCACRVWTAKSGISMCQSYRSSIEGEFGFVFCVNSFHASTSRPSFPAFA